MSVDALANDGEGRVAGGSPLGRRATDFIRNILGQKHITSHPDQISICYPGHPARDDYESGAAHCYRVKRSSAHVDGLHAERPEKRRRLRELHDFILGIPLDNIEGGAAPFVIWEGSHEIMREALHSAFRGLAPATWGNTDVTAVYHAARKKVFDTCPLVEVVARGRVLSCAPAVPPWPSALT